MTLDLQRVMAFYLQLTNQRVIVLGLHSAFIEKKSYIYNMNFIALRVELYNKSNKEETIFSNNNNYNTQQWGNESTGNQALRRYKQEWCPA